VPTKPLSFTIPLDDQPNTRWLLDIDRQGNERCQRLTRDTHVLTRERLVRARKSKTSKRFRFQS